MDQIGIGWRQFFESSLSSKLRLPEDNPARPRNRSLNNRCEMLEERLALTGVQLTDLSLTDVNEGGSATLSGHIDAPATAELSLDIDWGDGSGLQTMVYAPGTNMFMISHEYADDDPSGTASDPFDVSVTLTGMVSDGTGIIAEVEPNGVDVTDLENAQNVDDAGWTLAENVNIQDSTSIPHITIEGTGDGTRDHFAFMVDTAGVTGVFDIDAGFQMTPMGGTAPPGNFDSRLDLYRVVDGQWESLAFNDDINPADPGSDFGVDSLLEYTFPSAGEYFIRVSRTGGSSVPTGADYDLHISIPGHELASTTETDTATLSANIHNVAPSFTALGPVGASIVEGDTFMLTGSFFDPGLEDVHTVTIDWGDGEIETLDPLTVGARDFAASHVYLDDPAGPDNDYIISVSVADDDTGNGTGTTTLTVNNVAPSISPLTLSPAMIDENGELTLSGTFSDIGILDDHSITIDWGDGTEPTVIDFVDPPTELSFSHTHTYLDDPTNSNDKYTVQVTVSDDDGGSAVAMSSVVVKNVAPQITVASVTPSVIDEGQTVLLGGTYSDVGSLDEHTVSIDWGDGDSETLPASAVLDGAFADIEHTYDDDPSSTPDDYVITVSVTDDDGGTDTETVTVTVNNVAPVIDSLSLPGFDNKGIEGSPIELTAAFTDPGTGDTHTAIVDWGDGSAPEAVTVVFDGSSPNGTIQGNHTYTQGGIYQVTVTLTDDDDGEAVATGEAVISGVRLTDEGELQIIGTDSDDFVTVFSSIGGSDVVVYGDFLPSSTLRSFTTSSVVTISAQMCGGDDWITVGLGVTAPALLRGGAGDDVVGGGSGPAVLLGEAGDDYLFSLFARSILIGGTGQDEIYGGFNGDVLIGGTTSADEDDEALETARDEWSSGNTYNNRVTAIDSLLTVDDDGESDELSGGLGRDLFYDGTGDDLTDVRTGPFNPETVLPSAP